MESARRSLRARSDVPPSVGSSALKPMYMVEVETEVDRRMPCRVMSSVSVTSPLPATCTAWSKASEEIPDAS